MIVVYMYSRGSLYEERSGVSLINAAAKVWELSAFEGEAEKKLMKLKMMMMILSHVSSLGEMLKKMRSSYTRYYRGKK